MTEDPNAQVPSSAPDGLEPSRLGKVLTNRTIVISAVVVGMITGAVGWLLLGLYGAGTSIMKNASNGTPRRSLRTIRLVNSE